MAGISRPERGGGHFDLGRQVFRQPPRGLLERQPQTLDVDVIVSESLRHRLEAADRTIELLAGSGVLGGELKGSFEDAELVGGQADSTMGGQPGQRLGASDQPV